MTRTPLPADESRERGPALTAVTLSLSTPAVVFKNPVTLSGRVSSKQAGQSVSIQAQQFAFADTKMAPLATVTTDSVGAWKRSGDGRDEVSGLLVRRQR